MSFSSNTTFWKLALLPSSGVRQERIILSWACQKELVSIMGLGTNFSPLCKIAEMDPISAKEKKELKMMDSIQNSGHDFCYTPAFKTFGFSSEIPSTEYFNFQKAR
jgi:hypothetical protein